MKWKRWSVVRLHAEHQYANMQNFIAAFRQAVECKIQNISCFGTSEYHLVKHSFVIIGESFESVKSIEPDRVTTMRELDANEALRKAIVCTVCLRIRKPNETNYFVSRCLKVYCINCLRYQSPSCCNGKCKVVQLDSKAPDELKQLLAPMDWKPLGDFGKVMEFNDLLFNNTVDVMREKIAQNQIDEKRFLSDYDRMKQNGAATVRKYEQIIKEQEELIERLENEARRRAFKRDFRRK